MKTSHINTSIIENHLRFKTKVLGFNAITSNKFEIAIDKSQFNFKQQFNKQKSINTQLSCQPRSPNGLKILSSPAFVSRSNHLSTQARYL